MAFLLRNLFQFLARKEPPSIVWRDNLNPEAYEEARTSRLFNGIVPGRYPDAVIFAKTEQDIVGAVELAIEKGHRVSVRAGGHSYAAWSVRDWSVLLDLGDYSEIVLDGSTGIVRASPSVTGRELDRYLSARGRTFPAGHCPDVALGGFLLGGGMGWNTNNWGWACESLVALDLVTATGKLIRADANENSDLFWAARGGGPAFPGVVTRFHLRTQPTPKVMRSSGYVYPAEHYKTAFGWALKIASELENTIELTAIGSYQEGIDSPCITIILLAYSDDEDAVNELLKSADQSYPEGALSRWFCQETSLQSEFDNKAKSYPVGHRYKVDNVFLQDDADVADVLQPAFTTLPTRQSLALWTSMRPRSKRELTDMALSMQSDHYFALYAIWERESDDSQNESWLSGVMERVGQQSVGSYLGEYDFQARPTNVWGKEQYQRLMEIKKTWDPDNRICGCLGLDDHDMASTAA